MKKLLLLLLIASACGPAWKLKRAKQLIAQAKAAGAEVTPDTVTVKKEETFTLTAESDSTSFQQMVDKDSFEKAVKYGDSLINVIHALQKDTAQHEQQQLAKKALNNVRYQFSKGFYRDTAYVFRPDSLTQIDIIVKDGKITAKYKRDAQKVNKEVTYPIAINNAVQEPCDETWKWVALVLGGIILFTITLLVLKTYF